MERYALRSPAFASFVFICFISLFKKNLKTKTKKMIPRLRARRDENEAAIVAALERIGCTVCRLSVPNMPDLLVGYRGKNYLLEIKSRKGKLTEGQVDTMQSWRGQVAMAKTLDECLAAIDAL